MMMDRQMMMNKKERWGIRRERWGLKGKGKVGIEGKGGD